jgi:peptidoglycan/xylan/chitin deacetylase (PgdA/CDA1 family)
MSKKPFLLSILFLLPVFLVSGISFHDINLSSDDRVLFKAEFESEHAVFVSTLAEPRPGARSVLPSIQQLTAFPEKLQLVDNGRTIITVNRFGAARIPLTGGLPVHLPGYPSFAGGDVPLKGRIQQLAVSNDGRWILYVEPTSPAYGNLLLTEVSSGTRRVVSERVELAASDFPAKWSPDSRLFVYSKGGRLFYYPIINDMTVLADERFRMIGSGGINSVLWGQHGDFYYFLGNTLYRVRNPELFTRTIYGDFLSIGGVTAVLPLDFDSGFDRFWIAPDSESILVNKNGRGFFIFLLGENQNNSAASLPHVTIPFGTEDFNVLWSPSGRLLITSSLQNETIVWRFEINAGQVRNLTNVPGNVPASSNGALSPDGSRAVFWGENGLELWDIINWRQIQKLRNEPVFSCVWINNGQFISGSGKFIEEINISGANITNRIICLSGADEFGFEAGSRDPSRILARIENNWFVTDGRTPWFPAINPQLRQVTSASERYRVFLEPQPAGHFKNIPMVRSVFSANTVSLVSGHSANRVFTPDRQFSIALCFDLYDDDSGLLQILAALRRYNIRATFFLNGDFIRRNPLAAAAIAEAGHETASLFYAPIDFADSRYRITQDFITRGLARNEDEFFHATGREISPLWHPPFFRTSNPVIAAAASAGYATVIRTIDPGDELSREDAVRLSIRQTAASDMIEKIIREKRAGAVVPIRLGRLPGGRDEYLYQRIDVLLDALIRSGVEIVPVSTVIGR